MNVTSQAVPKAKQFLSTNRVEIESLLRQCIATKSLTATKRLHAHSITSGLLSSVYPTSILSVLSTAYAVCGDLSYARNLFDQLSEPKPHLYNTMIRQYAQKGSSLDALQLFFKMGNGGLRNKFTYPSVLKACGDLKLLHLGVCVHGMAMRCGVHLDGFIGNSLLAMYMNCRDKKASRKVFETMQVKTVVSWNTMISGYCKNGCDEEALLIFNKMMDAGVEADSATAVALFPACGNMKDLKCGRKIHSLVEEKGLGNNLSVKNALVDMYVKCGSMSEARLVFDTMKERDVVSWTTMVNGYILIGDATASLFLCSLMQLEGVRPNSVTVASLLTACADSCFLKQGRCLHGWTLRRQLEFDVAVETALVTMYAKCNCVRSSLHVFAKTSRKRTVPWNAVLSGLIHNRLAREAIKLFKEMLEVVKPNAATLNSLLPAYAILSDLQQAMNIHGYVLKSGFLSEVEAATGLIDIYSKCGYLEFAHEIYNAISTKKKDIICWSTLIAGYAMHGNGEVAVSLFNQMVQSGVKPNEVTFTSVLHACSHAGLVNEGLNLFKLILKAQQRLLCADHYTCIVDLLGRAGRLEEAYELIKTMPFQRSHAVWGALLGACVIHENVALGEIAAKWLFKLEPENTGNYVLMSKLYASAGSWNSVENTRRTMNEFGLQKTPAHSLMQIRDM